MSKAEFNKLLQQAADEMSDDELDNGDPSALMAKYSHIFNAVDALEGKSARGASSKSHTPSKSHKKSSSSSDIRRKHNKKSGGGNSNNNNNDDDSSGGEMTPEEMKAFMVCRFFFCLKNLKFSFFLFFFISLIRLDSIQNKMIY